MPPEAPGRAARLALRQPAEQMLPGSEPISGASAGGNLGAPLPDSCQPAKAPGRWASTSLLPPFTWKKPPDPHERPQDLPPEGGQGRLRDSPRLARASCRAGGQRAPALPGPVRAI